LEKSAPVHNPDDRWFLCPLIWGRASGRPEGMCCGPATPPGPHRAEPKGWGAMRGVVPKGKKKKTTHSGREGRPVSRTLLRKKKQQSSSNPSAAKTVCGDRKPPTRVGPLFPVESRNSALGPPPSGTPKPRAGSYGPESSEALDRFSGRHPAVLELVRTAPVMTGADRHVSMGFMHGRQGP